jgi:uridine kinase
MADNIKFIGVTGGSGSGKTSFLRELKSKFTKEQLCVISQDDYYRPRDEQKKDDQGVHNFDIPFSIDHEAFYKDLLALKNGQKVIRQEYTFNNKLATPKQIVLNPAPFILVEGIFIFHFEEIRNLLDIKIFLHAKDNLKVIRRIKRDQIERNYPLDDVLYRYQHHVLPTYEKYILPYMDDCDIVINNNVHFENSLAIFEGFLSFYLKKS